MSGSSADAEIQSLIEQRKSLESEIEWTNPKNAKKLAESREKLSQVNTRLYFLTTPPEIIEQDRIQFASQIREANRSVAKSEMSKGIGCFAVAAIVSALTYWLATTSESGGTYMVFRGAMAVGAFMLLRGVWIYFKNRG